MSSTLAPPSPFQTIDLLGTRCGCLDTGVCPSSDTPPLLLLHGTGLGGTALTYADSLPHLAPGRRVLGLDWPGYGDSDPDERAYTVAHYLDYLDAFLERYASSVHGPVAGPVDIAAFSMAGAIALEYARRRPDRVRRLVLIDSYGLDSRVHVPLLPKALASVPLVPTLFWRAMRESRRFLRTVLQAFVFTNRAPLPDDVVSAVQRELRKPQSERALMRFIGHDLGWFRLRTDLSASLATITTPTLLIHGERDLITPASRSRRAARIMPNAELLIVPKCGHWTPRQAPRVLAEAIERFLATPHTSMPNTDMPNTNMPNTDMPNTDKDAS